MIFHFSLDMLVKKYVFIVNHKKEIPFIHDIFQCGNQSLLLDTEGWNSHKCINIKHFYTRGPTQLKSPLPDPLATLWMTNLNQAIVLKHSFYQLVLEKIKIDDHFGYAATITPKRLKGVLCFVYKMSECFPNMALQGYLFPLMRWRRFQGPFLIWLSRKSRWSTHMTYFTLHTCYDSCNNIP